SGLVWLVPKPGIRSADRNGRGAACPLLARHPQQAITNCYAPGVERTPCLSQIRPRDGCRGTADTARMLVRRQADRCPIGGLAAWMAVTEGARTVGQRWWPWPPRSSSRVLASAWDLRRGRTG